MKNISAILLVLVSFEVAQIAKAYFFLSREWISLLVLAISAPFVWMGIKSTFLSHKIPFGVTAVSGLFLFEAGQLFQDIYEWRLRLWMYQYSDITWIPLAFSIIGLVFYVMVYGFIALSLLKFWAQAKNALVGILVIVIAQFTLTGPFYNILTTALLLLPIALSLWIAYYKHPVEARVFVSLCLPLLINFFMLRGELNTMLILSVNNLSFFIFSILVPELLQQTSFSKQKWLLLTSLIPLLVIALLIYGLPRHIPDLIWTSLPIASMWLMLAAVFMLTLSNTTDMNYPKYTKPEDLKAALVQAADGEYEW